MDTIHPERWTDDWFLWSKQLVFSEREECCEESFNKDKRLKEKDESSPREIEVAGFLNKIIFKISRGKKIKVLK